MWDKRIVKKKKKRNILAVDSCTIRMHAQKKKRVEVCENSGENVIDL